jgi:hypothetical protein
LVNAKIGEDLQNAKGSLGKLIPTQLSTSDDAALGDEAIDHLEENNQPGTHSQHNRFGHIQAVRDPEQARNDLQWIQQFHPQLFQGDITGMQPPQSSLEQSQNSALNKAVHFDSSQPDNFVSGERYIPPSTFHNSDQPQQTAVHHRDFQYLQAENLQTQYSQSQFQQEDLQQHTSLHFQGGHQSSQLSQTPLYLNESNSQVQAEINLTSATFETYPTPGLMLLGNMFVGQ